MKLHIVTVATHSSRYLPVLEKMVEDKNMKLVKLGFGKKYEGHFMKDKEVMNFVKDKPKDDIVLFLDGFDTLIFGSEEEIKEKFLSFNKKLVVSIENIRNSYLGHSYTFKPVKEKFINTGFYIGFCGYVYEFLSKMYDNNYSVKSNQVTWSNFLNEPSLSLNLDLVDIDIKSDMFLNHSFTCNNKFKFDKQKKRLVLNTGVEPSFIQGNGVVNLNSLIKNMGYDKYNIHKKDLLKEQIKYTYTAVTKTYPVIKFIIFTSLIILFWFFFVIYGNYKLRKYETINLTLS